MRIPKMKTMIIFFVCFTGILTASSQPVVVNNTDLSFRTSPNGVAFDRARNQLIFNDDHCQITIFDVAADFKEIGKTNSANSITSEKQRSRKACLGIAYYGPMDILWRLERAFPGVSTNLVGYNRTALLNGVSDQLVLRLYKLPETMLVSLTVSTSGIVAILDYHGIVRLVNPSRKDAPSYQLAQMSKVDVGQRSIVYHPDGWLIVATKTQPLTRIDPANGRCTVIRLENNLLPYDGSERKRSMVVLRDGRVLLLSSSFIGVLESDKDWTTARVSRVLDVFGESSSEKFLRLAALAKDDLMLHVLYEPVESKADQHRLELIALDPVKPSPTNIFLQSTRRRSSAFADGSSSNTVAPPSSSNNTHWLGGNYCSCFASKLKRSPSRGSKQSKSQP